MADATEQKEVKAPVRQGRQFTWGTGRRKTAIARVRVADGQGKIEVNGQPADAYFNEVQERNAVTAPLDLVDQRKGYDVFANVHGGGHSAQAMAIRLGLARAMAELVPDKERQLRDAGYLTRDSRMKERKKYGQKGARKRFQFSKR